MTSLERSAGALSGAVAAVNEATGAEVRLDAPVVVLAMGGINGSHAETVANWPTHRQATMLNGAHPFAGWPPHHLVEDQLDGRITHAGEMWNYAAGIPTSAAFRRAWFVDFR